MSESFPTFSCSGCGKSFKWKLELAGKKIKCKCGSVTTVPTDVAPPEPVEDMYDLAPDDEPPKRVHKVTVPAGGAVAAAGAGAAAAPVLGYKSGPTKREKERFSTETFIDMKRDAYAPMVLMMIGLALSVIYYAIHYHLGGTGIIFATLGVSAMTLVKAVLLIGFALVIAGPVGVGFGGVWTAALKLAAIAVFCDGVTTWVDAGVAKMGAGGMQSIISFPVALGIYWMLLIYLFSMDPGDSWLVVMLLTVFDTFVRWGVLLLLLNAVLSLSGAAVPASTKLAGAAPEPAAEMATRIQELEEDGSLREAHEYYTTQNHVGQLREQCEAWYAAGAKHVWYVVSSDINGRLTVLQIYVELPAEKAQREAIFKILNDYNVAYFKVRNSPYVPEPEKDTGLPYLPVGVPMSGF